MRPVTLGLATVAVALAVAAAAAAAGAKAAIQVPPTVRTGEPFVVRVPAGTEPPVSVEFLGKAYGPIALAGEPGPIFLAGTDLDASPGPAPIVLRWAGGREERRSIEVQARVFPEERLTLPPAMVTPPPELEERIVREQALAAEVYRTADPSAHWSGGFARAVGGAAAGNFGKRRILNGLPRSPHSGQDYAAAAGTPVHAIAGGRVRLARDLYYSGLTVLLDHGGGLVSQYFHLQEFRVREGQTVAGGEVVGLVGKSGRATGPHLHLGLRLFEQRVDPEVLFALLPLR